LNTGNISQRRRRCLVRRWSRRSPWTTVPQRFFSGTKTLTVPFPAIGHRDLHDLAVDAAPTQFSAMPEGFFSGGVALATAFFAFRRVGLDDVPVDATPAEIFAMSERFFARRIALAFALATFFGRGLDNLAVDAAPTLTRRSQGRRWRRRWRRRTPGTTGKRPRPTRRWLWRTRWMFAWRSTPFVTTAIRLPAPAPTVLFPNPLATIIVPLPASDLDRRQPEGMFIAVRGDSVADDDAGIADRPRDSQDFETALGKIAERVEIVHFVADIKKSVFGIVARSGGTDDHAGGVRAVADNAVCGGGVTAKRSEISDSEGQLGVNATKSAG
jgi:hypothetical protein